MISKKQKIATVIFVLIFAIAIVGGVFGVSYYKGVLTFPWQVSTTEEKKEEVAEKPEVQKPQQTSAEKPEAETAQKPDTETEKPENEESTTGFEKNETACTGCDFGYYGALSVKDGQLVDADGNAVQLTGVSTHGINWYPDYASEETITSLKENWGINVIRIAMYTTDYNGYCVGGDENQAKLISTIKDAVAVATDNDMYVIIDWHTLSDNSPLTYKNDAIQFFGDMVREFKKNENVIYEICNEPNGNTTWDDVKAYAQEVIPVIRNVDSDAVVLVGTPEWCSDLDSVVEDPLNFDNIMYTYHFYAGSHKASARSELTAALDEGLPVFISEYGLVNADGNGAVNTKQAEKWYDIIDEYKLSSCIWNLSNKEEGSALISADCDKVADWKYEELSEEGQYFIDKLSEENKRKR